MLPSAHHPLLFRFLLFCFGKWLFLYTMSFYKLVILCVAVMFSCVTVPVCTMNNLLCMFLFCLYLNIVDRRNKTSMRWIWVELTWVDVLHFVVLITHESFKYCSQYCSLRFNYHTLFTLIANDLWYILNCMQRQICNTLKCRCNTHLDFEYDSIERRVVGWR